MKRTLFTMLIVTFILAGCGGRAMSLSATQAPATQAPYVDSYGAGGAPGQPPLAMPNTITYRSESASIIESGTANVPNVPGVTQDRMVVKNADMSVVVKDPEKTMADISKMAQDMGGFVVSSNLYQTSTSSGKMVPQANVVIRVPAEKLDEALATIKSGAVEVQNENVSGQDVTSQYVDLQSQLKNLEAAEAQLVQIMSKAEKTEDVMNVFNQLTAIRGQIESIKGQMKYFEESAALSAISVTLVAEETVKPLDIGGWKPQGTARDAIQNLIIFWQDFVDFLIKLVLNFLPKLLTIGLVFGLPIWLIVRAVRNASRRRKAVEASKAETK
jgi:hypothetical protein